jgi:hypothetical protein
MAGLHPTSVCGVPEKKLAQLVAGSVLVRAYAVLQESPPRPHKVEHRPDWLKRAEHTKLFDFVREMRSARVSVCVRVCECVCECVCVCARARVC